MTDKPLLTPRSSDVITIIFLILLPPVFFWRETFGWLSLGDQDALFWFFPAYKFIAEQVKSGHLPLWTPYLNSGTPLFAQAQGGVLDPINWIYLIATTSRTLTLSLEMSFAISLLATFSYARSLGWIRRASVFSAVVYSLSGFAVGRTLYPGFLHIVALTPLVLYFVEKLYQQGRWRDVAGGASIIAWQIFAGHPQPIIYSSLLATAYALFRVRSAECGVRSEEGNETPAQQSTPHSALRTPHSTPLRTPHSAFRTHLGFLTRFCLMFIAGISLASVQLLPSLEIAGKSVRRQWPYELFTLHSLHPISLLTTLFPFFHGSGRTIYQLPYWGVYWHHNEAQIYLGVLALSLALAGSLIAWRNRYSIGIFWSVVAIAGVILAIGKYAGPLARMVYHVPLISQFRSPNRHWMEVTLAVALLAGFAIDRLLKDKSKTISRSVQVSMVVVALFCCVVGGFLLLQKDLAARVIRSFSDLQDLPQNFLQSASTEFYLPMITAVCVCIVLFIFTRSTRRSRWYGLLLLILLIDFNLYAAFAPINHAVKLEKLIGQAMPASLAAKQSEQEPFRYHVLLNPPSGEFSPFWFYGHEMVTGYDPALNERYKTFSGIDEAGRSYLTTMLEPQDRTLDLLNVRYIFIPPSYTTAITRWREVAADSQDNPYRDFRIYENLNVMPRAWLVDRVEEAYEGDQLKLIRGEKKDSQGRYFNLYFAALVEPVKEPKLRWYDRYLRLPDKEVLQSVETAKPVGAHKILERGSNRLVIETEALKPSVLVLSEIAFPGWRVRVDGRETTWYQVDYMLRGLPLGEGKHRVEFFYLPPSLVIGAAISITTLVCLLMIVFWERRRVKK